MIKLQLSNCLRRLVLAALIVYWIALVAGTHWPTLPQIGPKNFDKVLHVSAYCGLIVLLSLSLFWGRPWQWRRYAAVFLGLAAFGGFDELTQPPFHRTADWLDWFADLTGLSVGLALAVALNWAVRHWLQSRQKNNSGQPDAE
jgi:VanZ family protein